MKKTLCLYYTRTNTTKDAMEHLADLLGGDTAEYTDGKNRSGLLGYISCCLASEKKVLPNLRITGEVDLSEYDRVVVGMPVWAERPCVMGKAFLTKFSAQLPDEVYLLVTHSGKNDYEAKINQLDECLASPHKAHLSLRTKENAQKNQEIIAFAEKIQAAEG